MENKGTFVLNHERSSIPTNISMYDCVECLENGVEHKLIRKPGPPAPGNEFSMPGDPTTIRVCTGCNKYDGPWVPAPY